MHYLIGERDCDGIARTLFAPVGAAAPLGDAANRASASRAYARFLAQLQPSIPMQPEFGVVLIDDSAFENAIIDAFYHESPLDDLPRYRDRTFFENGPEYRAAITADVAWLDEAMSRFPVHDPAFWTSFGFFVNYILCPYSRYSRGGSDSAAIGALFISRPRSYSARDLYEILVHEFTHTVMFLDEQVDRHYADETLMAQPDHYARAAISGTARPLDKVLHSLVVATEVLLHRDHVLGHDGATMIHPPTPELLRNMALTIDSIRELDRRDDLLADRGLDLVDRCAGVVSAMTRA